MWLRRIQLKVSRRENVAERREEKMAQNVKDLNAAELLYSQ